MNWFMTNTTDIGIFDAKTRLSELLRRTQTGESFRMSTQEAAAQLREFMKQQPKITGLNIKALVEEGKK